METPKSEKAAAAARRREKAEARREWDARPDVIAARAKGKCGCRTRHKPPRPCKDTGAGAGGRCWRHGGESTGPKTWNAGGRYSKSPAVQAFREALAGRCADPALFDTAASVALLDELEDGFLERGLTQRDSPRLRLDALELAEKVLELLEGGDEDSAGELLLKATALRDLLDAGVAQDRVLLELSKITERRAKLALDTRSTMVREANVVTVQQLEMIYMRMITEAGGLFGPEKAAELERRVRRALGAEAALLGERAEA